MKINIPEISEVRQQGAWKITSRKFIVFDSRRKKKREQSGYCGKNTKPDISQKNNVMKAVTSGSMISAEIPIYTEKTMFRNIVEILEEKTCKSTGCLQSIKGDIIVEKIKKKGIDR